MVFLGSFTFHSHMFFESSNLLFLPRRPFCHKIAIDWWPVWSLIHVVAGRQSFRQKQIYKIKKIKWRTHSRLDKFLLYKNTFHLMLIYVLAQNASSHNSSFVRNILLQVHNYNVDVDIRWFEMNWPQGLSSSANIIHSNVMNIVCEQSHWNSSHCRRANEIEWIK